MLWSLVTFASVDDQSFLFMCVNLVPFMRPYLSYLYLLLSFGHCLEEVLGNGILVCVWKTRGQASQETTEFTGNSYYSSMHANSGIHSVGMPVHWRALFQDGDVCLVPCFRRTLTKTATLTFISIMKDNTPLNHSITEPIVTNGAKIVWAISERG
jgi:hypothetical protein